MTAAAVGELLGLTRWGVYRAYQRGELPAIRNGWQLQFDRAKVIAARMRDAKKRAAFVAKVVRLRERYTIKRTAQLLSVSTATVDRAMRESRRGA